MPPQATGASKHPFIEINDAVLNEMAHAIAEEVRPEKVIVFGSFAQNTSSSKSDVDLLVIEREPFGKGRSRLAELARIRSALRNFRIPKDILLYSEADIVELQSLPGHIVHECLRDGRVLYERPRTS
jgi:predicted nucleotidyltransferase